MASLIPELYCTSITASRKFYTEILGFEVLYERPENKFVMLERQGAQIMLEEIGASREWITAPLEHPFGRGVNFQIQTTAVDDLYVAVQRADATIFLPMEEKWYRADRAELGNRQFIVQDPDGYLLRFFQDLGAQKTP
jgi:catechol 2,3-dioxygenase-like lactoylglutathione lyase family enzyme